MTILCFGDSITWGSWDPEGGGWVTRLRRTLEMAHGGTNSYSCPEIYNLGVSGNTTQDLINRFENEIKPRAGDSFKPIVIFSLGINDSKYYFGTGHVNPPDKFKKNLVILGHLARKYTQRIIFLGLFPVDDSRTDPLPEEYTASYKNDSAQKYNDIIKAVAESEYTMFINIFDEIMRLPDYQNLLSDGLHPNSAGHRQISEIVHNFLINNSII